MEKLTFMSLMHEGGTVMWILLVFSVLVVATAIERALVMRRAEVDVAPLVRKIEQALMRRRSPAEAIRICDEFGGAAARVGRSGLRRFDGSAVRIEKAIERQGATELRHLQRRLGVLSAVAVAAPLLGFLGTVVGMILSFGALASFGQANPEIVALGIKQALTTTAAGLTVALPAQLLHNFFAARVDRIAGAMETVGYVLLEARAELGGS